MYKRLLILAAVICMAAGLMLPGGAAGDTLERAALKNGDTRSGMVRVRLSSLGSPATVNLTVYGVYSVNGDAGKVIPDGAAATVHYNSSSGQFTLTYSGKTADMGSSFTLRRHESSLVGGIKIAQSRKPGNLYPGDLQFLSRLNNGSRTLYIIEHVYMEDYLYGVLPYEMSSSAPVEALKAQAVASRTYTMRAMNGPSTSIYDLVDTTSDQVYNGTPSGNANCVLAVDGTKGVVAQHGSVYTATYYTASNGGQTESIKNAWSVNSAYTYLGVKDDPYDLANPDSKKVSFTVSASGSQKNSALGSLLNQKASNTFGAGAQVTGVTAVTPHTPKYASPSRLYTKLDFSVLYTQNGQTGSGVLTFDIFSELESPLGMSINSGKNELWSVEKTASGFTVTARRYGHGIGMSQRGAIQMAREGYAYDQILAFYFEGCTRVCYTLTRSILAAPVAGQESQEHVIAESPAPLDDPGGPDTVPVADAVRARVTTASGSLNLRASASGSAKVLCTIPANTVITLSEKGDTWCKTVYNGQTGYVMTKYLTILDSGEATPAPTATIAPVQEISARVTTSGGSLNLRASASGSARVLRTIPANTLIPVLEKGDTWCKTEYGGQTGYVMTAFLTFVQSQPASTATPAPTVTPAPAGGLTAYVTTASGSLNLRAAPNSGARVLCAIPQFTLLTIDEQGPVWCKTTYNGQSGYVMTSFLTFIDEQPAATATPAPTAAPTAEQYAQVVTASGSLNLRASASGSAKVLLTIPQFGIVTVLNRGTEWSCVIYNGVTGYVMSKFLQELTALPTDTPAPTAAVTPAPTETATLAPESSDPLYAQVNTASGSLNLRASASDSARVLRTVPQYGIMTVLAWGGTWSRVTFDGVTGYVMTRFLKPLSGSAEAAATPAPTASVTPAPASGITARVRTSGGTLNLRTQARDTARVIAAIPYGAAVTVLNKGAGWCQVVYSGKTGYVMTRFLAFDAASDGNAEVDPTLRVLSAPITGRVADPRVSLNLRAGCSADADILLEIPGGEYVTITAVGDTWCAVEYEGKTGYSMKKYLEFTLYE